MTKEEIENAVIELIYEELYCRKLEITPEVKFVEDLGADSLDLINLVMALESWAREEGYELDIEDAESERLDTVGKVTDYLVWKLGVESKRPFFLDDKSIGITGYLGSHRPV